MNKLLLLVFALCAFSFIAKGQAGRSYITIYAKDVYAGVNDDGGPDEFTWGVSALNLPGQCITIDGEAGWFNVNRGIRFSYPLNNLNTDVALHFEAFEDDSGSRCTYTTSSGDPDDDYCQKDDSVNPYAKAPPGVNRTVQIDCGPWSVVYEYSYTPPVPSNPSVYVDGAPYSPGNICGTSGVTLQATSYIDSNFFGYEDFYWEYQINGETQDVEVSNPAYCGSDPDCGFLFMSCCNEPPTIIEQQPVWRWLGAANLSNNAGNMSFQFKDLDGLQNISSNTAVTFRVRGVASGSYSAYSGTVSVDVSPLAPVASSVTQTPSCLNGNNGVIDASGITGATNDFRYMITTDPNGSGPTGSFSGSSIPSITNLSPGNYFLFLNNNGGSVGACANVYPITVTTYPGLSLNLSSTQNISCPAGSDGIIRFSTSGGKPGATINFSISPVAGTFVRTGLNSGEFQNLSATSYTVFATDNCSSPNPSLVASLTQPSPVLSVSFNKTDPDCFNPANGVVSASVSGGSGSYNYKLYQGASPIRTVSNSGPSVNLTDIPGGIYTLDVRDAARPSCAGYLFGPFTINSVTPLAMTHTNQDVTCFGANDGQITLLGSGGSGNLKYILVNTTTSQVINNTTGSFSSLVKGNYTASVMNNNSCTDVFSTTGIIINEPDDIMFSIALQKIRCTDEDNGKLTAVVSGGNGGNQFQWQYDDGTGWKDYSLSDGQTLMISNLFPSDYRLRVTDSKNCIKTSSTIAVINPAILDIPTVTFTHVTCLNANDGTIQVIATGGWGSYTYFYSSNGGSTYSPLLSTTLLPPGTYDLRAADAEGCNTDYAGQVIITEPSQVISASYSYSNYNGFKVSCRNGSDGQITVTATGGNDVPFPNGIYTYSVDGGPFVSSNILSGLASGSHEIRVKDLRGCIYVENLVLDSPPPLIISLASKNYIKCFGDNTGFIEVAGGGGFGSYQFSIDGGPFQVSPMFTNLAGGGHTATVKDGNNCTTSYVEVIDTPNPALVINFNKTDVTCFGADDGKITAVVSGGAPPYVYVWTGRSETGTMLQDLAPNTYTLSITDQEGCTLQNSVAITQPSGALAATLTPKPVQCFGDTNGEIKVNATGGTTPHSYSIDNGSNFQASDTFLNLAPGSYSILIKDFNGCTFIVGTTITEPPVLSITVIGKQDILCYGESTGSIQTNATGGVPPYEYSVDGVTYVSSSNLTLVPAGSYVVRVRDTYGCIRTATTTLTQPVAPLSLTFVMTPEQCKGDSNGSMETTIAGGTPPYSYAWAGLSETTSDIHNLPAATYTLTVTDGNGCKLITPLDITEPAIALQPIVLTKSNISCFGEIDGTFKAGGTGGYPPYLFSFEGSAYSTTDEYFGLSAQLYSVSIKDAKGCTSFMTVTISEPAVLTATIINIQNVSCFSGADGKFEVSIAGGTGPFTYSKNGGTTFQAGSLFDLLSINTYAVVVKDVNGCSFSLNAVVTEPTLLQSQVTNIVNSACGQANGSAQITGTGGTPPYQYTWKNSSNQTVSTSQIPTNLFAGFYTVTTTDSKNCFVDKTLTINDDNAPTSVITGHVDATCFNSTDGQAGVSASGGAGGYTYLWSDSRAQTTPTATNLLHGNYFVTVSDSRGCKSIATITIDSPSEIQYTLINKVLPLCDESCNGEINISAFGGVGPYTYSWLTGESSTTGHALNLCKGIHKVKVTDAIGCSVVFDLVIDAPAKLDIALSSMKAALCSSVCDASVSVIASGGTAPYTYRWDDALQQTTPLATGLCSGGTYNVTITDSHGCAFTKAIVVDKTPPLTINLGGTATLCFQQTKTLDAGVANATYQWTKDKIAFGNGQTIEIKDAGTYELQLVDPRGCAGSSKIVVTTSTRAFETNFLGATELIVGDTLLLTEVCVPKPEALTWSFGNGIRVLQQSPDQPQVTADIPGDYTIKLSANYAECSDVMIKTVSFLKPEDRGKINGRLALGLHGIKSLKAHPNPTSGLVNLDVELFQEETVAVFLYNMEGLEIARGKGDRKSSYQFNFDLTNYTSGIYLVRVATNDQRKDLRVVLMK